jgi:hypothetical protein
MAKRDLQELLELGTRQFARSHDKFAVSLLAVAPDVALNAHVIGKVRKHDRGLSIPKQRHVRPRIKRGSADDPVCSETKRRRAW